MARKFFYVCAGMLMVALSYHFGASTASAQAPGNPVVAALTANSVVTANGDVYYAPGGIANPPWLFASNVFGGGPTPALHGSWGQLKSRYATPPATPGMTAKPGADNR
jgi:hypothetical protein